MIDNKINMVEEFPLETMEELYTPEDQIIVDDEEADNENQKILKRSQLYWKDYLEEKNYNRDINKMCDICIADQKATHGKVVIKCKGLADIRTELGDELVDEYEECLPPEEFRKIQSLYDPYAFMEEFLDVDNKGKEDRRFAKRWYQEMAIRCVHEDTFIHLFDGTYKAIKDINIGEKVVSYDTNKLSVNYNIITNKWYSGKKEVFKISLDNDSILEVTKEHPILIEGNTYLSLEDGLTIGDKVVSYTEDVIVLVTVIDIVSIGVHNTYDIEVENDHNFIANTVVVHNCTAQEKNIRMGRRCIPHYEKVLTKDGYRPISELKVGDLVKSLNSKNQKFRYSPITKVINNGIKVVFRLTLKNGKKVECTENHPLLIKTSKGKQWSTLETGLFIGHKVCYRKRNKIFTSELVDIERVGEVLTYDISVGKDATFLVDDIITHNTGKSFALSLLIIHRAVMAKSTSGYRILIVSPFAAQTEEVVDNIINICRLLLDDPIKSFKGSPNHEIIFKTGAILKGFTASKEANSIRGQPGDLLVIDECLKGSTLITTPTGLVPIKDVRIGDTVLTYLDGELVEDTVINSKSTGIKTVRDYTFSNGTVLTGTGNHPVMTPSGWGELGKASSILVPKTNLYTNNREEILARLYGYSLGDGWLCNNQAGFSGDVEGLSLIREDINKLYPEKWNMNIYSRQTTSPEYNIVGQTNSFVAGKELHDALADYGLITRGRKVESIYELSPKIISGTDKVKAEFLAGLFGAEGTLGSEPKIGFTPKTTALALHKCEELFDSHKLFMNSLVTLLADLRIKSTLYVDAYTKSATKKIVLSINNELHNHLRFLDIVGVRYCGKKNNIAFLTLNYLKYLKTKSDLIKETIIAVTADKKSGMKVKDISKKYNITKSQVTEYYSGQCKGKFSRLDTEYYSDWLSSNVIENELYTSVLTKSEEYQEEVYNLTVGSNHTYIANGLLTHNCDDMPVKAMVSIMGIRMGRPNVEVWKSGTPKGEKNLFAGDQKVTSKSFHFPSFVIPHYTDELDADNRADLGEIGYVQEVIAEYGAVANGVYQSDFLRRAQERPVFTTAKEVLGRRNNFIVITGVDWNGEGVGVRIITVAYNKFSPDFKIIDRQEISMIGKTQDEAVNTIIEVNRKFKVDHLYCDIGYGAYQVEALKIFGERAFSSTPKGHPDRKLVNVIGVNFGGTTDLKDHRTGEVHKVPTKQFAVQNSVLLLEKDLISLHPKEDHVMLLQMKNYIEKSRNKGRIVYTTISKKIGDHDLDAFIFALYGFKIEYPTIFGEASMRAMIRYGDETGTSNVDVLGADVPFISLSFGSKQNAMIGHSSRTIKGSTPGRSIVIGNIRRRDNFR